jgi:NlpC/P60 family putative phage cell wall peptidase
VIAEQRALVVAEARKWIGTPYHHAADIIGVGCDCGMLLVRVFVDTGLCAPFDPRPYTHDWYMHRAEESYLSFITERGREVETPLPGDVMLFKYGRCFSHGGIVTVSDPLTIVHAYWPAGVVMEDVVSSNPALLKRSSAAMFASYWRDSD